MDPANMDYTMPHPDHHHPHYQQHHHSHHHHHHHPHHATGVSSLAAANRCPAMRATGGQRSFQFTNASSARNTEQYDPVHGHPNNRNMWQSRSPQNWQPAMIAPYAPAPSTVGTLPTPMAAPNQPSQPSFPACPVPNVPDAHLQNQPFPRHGAAVLPAPRLQGQASFDRLGGFQASNLGQHSTQNSLRPLAQRANTSLPSAASLLAGSPQVLPATSLTVFRPMEQAMPFGNENARPEQQLPDITNISLPQVSQGTSQPLPQQIPDPMPQINTANIGGRSTAARPPSIPASTAPQRNHDHPTRISNPVDIRRASVGTMSRARQRYSTSNNPAFPEWLLENGNIMFRRDSPTSVEYVANLAPIARGAKRVASRRALASLQSVNIADLPESERTCVICYNDFGVANPEGVNEAPLRLPKCKHVFGDHCIKKWFQESDSCPYCRDKVHSEIQNFPSRRNNSGNRLPATLLAAEEFFEYYTDSDREPLRTRDRNVSGPESSAQQEVEFSNFAVLDNMGFRSPSGSLRAETNARHPTRPPWGPGYDRRSPPIAEHDRRRRPRQRARNSQSSNRGNVSGSQNSNGPSQPLFTWNTALPGNPLTEAPAPNAYVAPFENLPPHLISRHDDYVALTGNHPSGLPQMRPDAIAGGFSSETPNGAFDVHMLNSENVHPNVSAVSGHVVAQPSMFTSYQQQS